MNLRVFYLTRRGLSDGYLFPTTAKKPNNWCYTSLCGTNKKEDTLTDVLFFI